MADLNDEEHHISTFVYICGRLAPLFSIMVFMSPIPTIERIKNEQCVGALPLLPYSSMIASTYLWVVYGILKRQSPIVVANAPGVVLGIYYFYYFTKFCLKSSPTLPGSVTLHYVGIALIIGLATVLPLVIPAITSSVKPAELVGMSGVILTVALFASPLAALKTVLSTRSAQSIPLPFTITTVLNCFLWNIYGIYDTHDRNIYIPNTLGLSFGLIQVALKVIFYNNDKKYDTVSLNDENVPESTDASVDEPSSEVI